MRRVREEFVLERVQLLELALDSSQNLQG
jgi:hypothetical protein